MTEFLFSLFYFIVFCFIISKISFFKDAQIPRHWFIAVFGIKVIVSVFLTLIYTHYYTDRNTADIFKYFDDSEVMFNALKTNPIDYFRMVLGIDNQAYFTTSYYQSMGHWTRPYSSDLVSDSHIIIRFNAFVRLFSFGHFQVHNVFINFISLLGLTLLFKAFKPFLLAKEKVLFYVIFLVPSILFWGSGLLKESIIFFALGLLLYNLFKLTTHFKPISLLSISVGILLIVFTKFYLLIALSVPVLGYLTNHYLKLKKPSYGYLISVAFFCVSIYVAPLINNQIDIVAQIVSKQQTFSRFVAKVPTNSGFLIPELTDGFSILINLPNALLNTVVRPFFWECNSLFVWMSAIENSFIILCIAFAIYFKGKMSSSQKNSLFFNLLFVFCLFSVIGLTTPVFGAIIRYKIPGVLLLMISLVVMVDLERIKKKHPLFKKIL